MEVLTMNEKITKERLVIYLEQYQELKLKYDELRKKYYDSLLSGATWDVSSSLSYDTAKESLLAITSLICDSLIDSLDVPGGVENV